MPSGRDIHSTKPFVLPALDAETLAQMRAPPERDDNASNESDSSSDNDIKSPKPANLPGAFPRSSTATNGNYF